MTLISENEKRELFGVDGKSAGKKDWVGFAKAKDAEVAAGGATEPGKAAPAAAGKGGELASAKGGDPAKAKAKGRTKGAGGGGFGGPFAAKFQNISPEDRQKMKTASPEERNEILKKAGFTDDELEQMRQMREQRWRWRWRWRRWWLRRRRLQAAAVVAAPREEVTSRESQLE